MPANGSTFASKSSNDLTAASGASLSADSSCAGVAPNPARRYKCPTFSTDHGSASVGANGENGSAGGAMEGSVGVDWPGITEGLDSMFDMCDARRDARL